MEGKLSGNIVEQPSGLGGGFDAQLHIGIPGKSAYQYAVEAGYTGTEQEFAEALAQVGGGTVDEAAVQRIVEEYLAENPPVTQETDPTVPDWAKQPTKPEYTAQEVGALPDTTKIPAKPEDIGAQPAGDYLTEAPVTSVNGKTGAVRLSAADVGARPADWMPGAADVGALPDTYVPPDQTAEQVGADPEGTAARTVSGHNTDTEAHQDLRLELQKVLDKLNAFFDTDDATLDQLSEILTVIKGNQSLIEAVTTGKVNVSDIIDNLTTNVANKPLSAAQGVVLKGLIDTLSASLSGYQPKGNYALKSEIPSVPVQSVNGKTGAVNLSASDVGARPDTWMPTAAQVGARPNLWTPTASEVGADPSGTASGAVNAHNSDTSAHPDIRNLIEGKLGRTELPEAVEDALEQAKASGEFDGDPGQRGTGLLAVTTAPSSYTTAVGGITPKYRMAISTIKSQSKATEVLLGDTIRYSYYHYPIAYLDATYAYCTTRVSIRGAGGSDATVTYESIQTALGYVPLDPDDVLQETEYTIAPYTNMLDRYGYVSRSQLNRNGSVSEATWNVWVSNFFPVRKGQKVHIKFKDGATFKDDLMFALYDANKTLHDDYHIAIYLSAITANPTVYGALTINGSYAVWDTSTIGYGGWSGFAYARIMYESTDCVITVDEEITENVETVYELKPTVTVPKNNLSFDVAEKPLVGKTVVCFGDSLFAQTTDETSALYHTAQITGADLYNVGFGGTSAAKVGSGAFAQFSLPALTDAIISGTWTTQDSNVSAASGFDEQLSKLKGINFSAVDIIVLHYGTNDFMSAYTLEGTAVTSVCGGLRYSIEKLLAKYPQIKFFVSVPCFRYWGSSGAYTYPDTYTNSNGAKLTDFVEGIRKVAAEYNFPVIDSFYGMGVNKHNAAHYLADQTHHSVAGRKLFGEFIASQLTSQQASAKSGMDTDAVQRMIDAAIAAIPIYAGEVV